MKKLLRASALSLSLWMLLFPVACSHQNSTKTQGGSPMSPSSILSSGATPEESTTLAESSSKEPILDLDPVPFHTVDNHKTEVVAGGYKIDMGDLPQVYFAEHPQWTELYNISWQLHKSKIQRIPAATNPERPYYVDEAFSGNIFVWDTIFMMLYDRYGMNQFPILSSLENFYHCQTDSEGKDNGYIPREIIEDSGKDFWGGYTDETSTNPPLFSWAEWSCYQIHGDVTRFSKEIDGKTIYQRLCDHYEFIEKNKRVRLKLYGKTNGLGTGLDDSPNQGGGQTYNSLCMQQAQNAYYLSLIAEAMGNSKDAKYYKSEHERISALINEHLWNEEHSMYSNLTSKGEQTNISTPTSLWALVARVASKERAEKMVKNQALNADKLFRPNGLSTLAYDHPSYTAVGGYWCGAIWAPTSYQYIKGLDAYGYTSTSFEESVRLVNTLSSVYQAGKQGGYVKKATIYENYSAEYIRQGFKRLDWELTRPDFAGWTPCISIGLTLENLAGVTINAPENTVDWQVNLTEQFSVSNLYFVHNGQANRVSLAAAERNSATDPLRFTVKCDHPFTLRLSAAGVSKDYQIKAGEHTYLLGNTQAENEKTASLSITSAPVSEGCPLSKEQIDGARCFIYFQNKGESTLSSYSKIKGEGIFNLSTVGRPTPTVTVGEKSALESLGYNGSRTLSRSYYAGGNEGFMLCADASKEQQTLTLLVTVGAGAKGILSASLSDASAKEQTLTLGEGRHLITIPYSAASEGRYLLVKWCLDNSTIKTDKTEDPAFWVSLEGILLSKNN